MNNRKNTYMCYALILLFAMFLIGTSPLLPEISKTFNLTTAQSGTIFVFNFIGFVCFVLLGGIASDKFGKKKVVSIALVGFTISLALFPVSGNYFTACAVMLFLGGFGGLIESTLGALVSDLNTENTSFYINMLQVFFGVGALVGPLIISILISNGIMWQINYYLFSGISAILTTIFLTSKFPNNTNNSESFNLKSVKALISDKKVILVGLCMVLYTGAEVGCWGWMATFLKNNMHFSALKSSIAIGVFWTAITVGRFVCGPLILRFGARKVVVWLAFSSIFVIILSGIVKVEVALWIIIALMGFAFSSQWALIAAYGSENYKEISGTAFSLFVASGGIGGAIVPYAMGVISEKIDMSTAMISPSILFVIVTVIFINFGRKKAVEKTVTIE